MRKSVENYEGYYEVDDKGNVYSLERRVPHMNTTRLVKGRILSKRKWEYLSVMLYIGDGKPKSRKIHRLVAKAFVSNPENKPHINHKDGNKYNNHYTNLEWCTPSENQLHSIRNGLKSTKKINQLTLDGKFIKTFNSASDAAEAVCGIRKRNAQITANIAGRRKSAFNFKWEYHEAS